MTRTFNCELVDGMSQIKQFNVFPRKRIKMIAPTTTPFVGIGSKHQDRTFDEVQKKTAKKGLKWK